jgi:predicted ATP-dependent endonuclease of OLD family
MFIELKNINRIKHAKIKIGGLAVLAGDNDTGKSTVGKVLFSVIKSLVKGRLDSSRNKKEKISRWVEKLYYTPHEKFFSEHEKEIFKENFHPPLMMDQLNEGIILSPSPSFIIREMISESIDNFLLKKKDFIENFSIQESIKSELKSQINEIKNILLDDSDEMNIYLDAIKRVCVSEFSSKVCSWETDKGDICLLDGDNLFSITVSNDGVYKIDKHLTFETYWDATFIETPLYIQLKDALDKTGTLYDMDERNKYFPKIPLHIKDLLKKLEYSRWADKPNEFSSRIKETIEGDFFFDLEKNEFVFRKEIDKQPVSFQMGNVASGIKVFGIIQLLLDAQEIAPDKLLILDEPENHLHPAWQLVFARLILELVQKHIPVILTSHSPYFIQALKHYAKVYDMEEEVSFYLAETAPDDLMVNIEEVTSDLNRVFVKLAKPFQDIM